MVFQDRAGIHGAAFDPVEPVIAVLFLAAPRCCSPTCGAAVLTL
jgi:hypothetical protein